MTTMNSTNRILISSKQRYLHQHWSVIQRLLKLDPHEPVPSRVAELDKLFQSSAATDDAGKPHYMVGNQYTKYRDALRALESLSGHDILLENGEE